MSRGKGHRPKFSSPAECATAVHRIVETAASRGPIDRAQLAGGLFDAAANFAEGFWWKEAASDATYKEAERACAALEKTVQRIEAHPILKDLAAFNTAELRQALSRVQAFVQFENDRRDPRTRAAKKRVGRQLTRVELLIYALCRLHNKYFASRGTPEMFVYAALKELVEPECSLATIERAFSRLAGKN